MVVVAVRVNSQSFNPALAPLPESESARHPNLGGLAKPLLTQSQPSPCEIPSGALNDRSTVGPVTQRCANMPRPVVEPRRQAQPHCSSSGYGYASSLVEMSLWMLWLLEKLCTVQLELLPLLFMEPRELPLQT